MLVVVYIFIVGYPKTDKMKKIQSKKSNKKYIGIAAALLVVGGLGYMVFKKTYSPETIKVTEEIKTALLQTPDILTASELNKTDFYFISILSKNHKNYCKWINYNDVVGVTRRDNAELLTQALKNIKSNSNDMKEYVSILINNADKICKPLLDK